MAPLFIRGEVEFGVVTQSAMAFAQLLGAFSLIVNQFQSLSSFAAVIARLDAIGEAVEHTPAPDAPAIAIVEDRDRLAYEGLTLRAPEDGRTLVKDLSVSHPAGTRLLVTGPNEAARVALFRATAGLWPRGRGRSSARLWMRSSSCPNGRTCPPGRSATSARCRAERPGRPDPGALRAVGLGSVASGPAGSTWRGLGGLRFARRPAAAGLARVILAGPRFALLDRVETTLGSGQVQQALQWLAENSITYIHMAEAAHPPSRTTRCWRSTATVGGPGGGPTPGHAGARG